MRTRRAEVYEPELEPSLLLYVGRRRVPMGLLEARLLRFVKELGSLARAARAVGLSYRAAWGRIRRLERRAGLRLLSMRPGGRGGGKASLTEQGEALLKRYRRARKHLFNALQELEFWGHLGYVLSVRNRLRARVVEVRNGPVACEVKMQLTELAPLTSLISREAAEELGLRQGDEVIALVKATDVAVAKA